MFKGLSGISIPGRPFFIGYWHLKEKEQENGDPQKQKEMRHSRHLTKTLAVHMELRRLGLGLPE
jgi:hypothetical protein